MDYADILDDIIEDQIFALPTNNKPLVDKVVVCLEASGDLWTILLNLPSQTSFRSLHTVILWRW